MATVKNVFVHPERVKDHAREHLSQFVINSKNFKTEDERKGAETIYLGLLEKEQTLQETMKKLNTEYSIPLKSPPKAQTFNFDVFSKSTSDNVLTKALKAQFVTVAAAAWEYLTLKQSNDSLTAMNGGATQSEKNRRDGRFGTDKAGSSGDQGPHVTNIPVVQTKTDHGPQAPTENVDNVAEHMHRLHHHKLHSSLRGLDFYSEHDKDPPSDPEDEDDGSRSTLLLLWSCQEYFDPRFLSKAQAEYNFYRQLEKQWKKTLRRVKMEDIKYPKFAMADFKGFARTRPLYAVIQIILDTFKDKKLLKSAEAAAEEYHKYTILENHMNQQHMISSVPQGIELDHGQYKEIHSEMMSKLKSVKAELSKRIPFKSMALFDYLKLKETITSQRKQIDDLASKLSGIASQQLADGDPGFTDLGDKNRPQKLGERFAELFDETWSSAYETLKPKNPDADDDESDEGTMDTLQKIVKVIYDFCQNVSKDQIQRLIVDMLPPVQDPVQDQPSKQASEQMRTKTEQMAREFRKVAAPETVKVLQQEIFEKDIKGKLLQEPISNELKTYVDQCVDLIWFMCIQQPPMLIYWAPEGEKFNREHFRFSGRKGKKYKLTVWPAVFLHEGGPLVASGYAVPSK